MTDIATLLVVACHYENGDEVRTFIDHLRSLSLPPGWDLAIAVCDNSGGFRSSDGSLVFRAPRNFGYLNGCAFALEKWRNESAREPELTIVANTDITFSPDALTRICALDVGASIAAIAPDVRLLTGARQNPFLVNRPSRLRMFAYRIVFRSVVLSILARLLERLKLSRSRGDDSPARSIYAAHGSVICLTRSFFVRGGSLAYGSFLFGEEIFLAEQVRRQSLYVRFEPDIRVEHKARASTGHLGLRQRIAWQRESADYLWREFFAPGRS